VSESVVILTPLNQREALLPLVLPLLSNLILTELTHVLGEVKIYLKNCHLALTGKVTVLKPSP
jgi:hypothetical protein